MRYIIGVLIAIGLVVLTIIILVKLFRGGPATIQTPLTTYTDTATTMQFTIDGPETADQTHRSVQIIVGQNQTTINVIQGYQDHVIASKNYSNNPNSYGVFLRALQLADFNKGNSNPAQADYSGYCPNGTRYVYEIVSPGGQDAQEYWNTSCGQGTFGGNSGTVLWLFQNQIPDYGLMTQSLTL